MFRFRRCHLGDDALAELRIRALLGHSATAHAAVIHDFDADCLGCCAVSDGLRFACFPRCLVVAMSAVRLGLAEYVSSSESELSLSLWGSYVS